MKSTEDTPLTPGGIAACDQLYRSEHPRVLRLCRLLLMNRQEGEEVAHDVFLRLVRERAANKEVVSWEAWLTTVAVNACRDRRRSAWWKRWSGNHTAAGQETELPADADTPEGQILSRERQEHLWRLFGALAPRQREVFVLRRLDGFSTNDTARVLGLTSGSVKRHLFHAIRHLQKAIGEP